MKATELQQIHARYFQNSPEAEGSYNRHEIVGFKGSDKTWRTKRERAKLKYGVLLHSGRIRVRGQVIGNTFRGSVRETFNLRNNK